MRPPILLSLQVKPAAGILEGGGSTQLAVGMAAPKERPPSLADCKVSLSVRAPVAVPEYATCEGNYLHRSRAKTPSSMQRNAAPSAACRCCCSCCAARGCSHQMAARRMSRSLLIRIEDPVFDIPEGLSSLHAPAGPVSGGGARSGPRGAGGHIRALQVARGRRQVRQLCSVVPSQLGGQGVQSASKRMQMLDCATPDQHA